MKEFEGNSYYIGIGVASLFCFIVNIILYFIVSNEESIVIFSICTLPIGVFVWSKGHIGLIKGGDD